MYRSLTAQLPLASLSSAPVAFRQALMLLQQLNGQNFYYYYGAVFFNSAGTGLK